MKMAAMYRDIGRIATALEALVKVLTPAPEPKELIDRRGES